MIWFIDLRGRVYKGGYTHGLKPEVPHFAFWDTVHDEIVTIGHRQTWFDREALVASMDSEEPGEKPGDDDWRHRYLRVIPEDYFKEGK